MFCAGNCTQNHRFLAIKIHPKDWDDIEGIAKSRWFSNQIVCPGEKRPSVFFEKPVSKWCVSPPDLFWEAIEHRAAGFRKKNLVTLKTNSKRPPKKWWLEDQIPFKKRSLFQGTMMNFRGVVPIGATSKHSNFNREILKGEKKSIGHASLIHLASFWP